MLFRSCGSRDPRLGRRTSVLSTVIGGGKLLIFARVVFFENLIGRIKYWEFRGLGIAVWGDLVYRGVTGPHRHALESGLHMGVLRVDRPVIVDIQQSARVV